MKIHTIEELNKSYEAGTQADDELYAEQRSNLLLVSGQHYSKKSTTFFNNVRNSARINESQKLRLTKNHIHKISMYYQNSILAKAPGVTVAPQNDLEMQDRKQAQLNLAVWQWGKERYKLKERTRELANHYVDIGEVCSFIYFDPNIGEFKGYNQKIDPATEQPMVDDQGQMVPDEDRPEFSGDFVFKTIPGFNIFRCPTAKTMKSSAYVGFREMIDVKELKNAYAGDEEKLKKVGDGDQDEFVVFDANKSRYQSENNQILLRYHFYRKCKQYPNGYFYVSTKLGILEHGELPFGVFPIAYEGFNEFATNPRAYSIIKIARPYQAEINRASSQAATHQITVGDDKIIYQGGTKLAPGALLPGVRGITYQGAAPQILPGRDGGQFLPYIQNQISEMYTACMLEEISAENQAGQVDPYALLMRTASQQQRFSRYTEKFESFQKQECEIFLELAKKYLPDDTFIVAVGKSEQINLEEFRSTKPLSYQIKVEVSNETIETRVGKQLAINQVLQYVGGQMDPKQIGLLLKEMPFLNNKTLTNKMSIDYDNVENDMLQMERAKPPFVGPYADNKIYIDAITHRMKQADFSTLSPEVQNLYHQYLDTQEDEMARKAKEIQAAKDGFIPTGGSLITLSMQVSDPSTASGTRQVRLPYEAVNWLMQKLEGQGTGIKEIEGMNQGAIAEMAPKLSQGHGPQQPMPSLSDGPLQMPQQQNMG